MLAVALDEGFGKASRRMCSQEISPSTIGLGIEERWLASGAVAVGVDRLVDSFGRVELVLGRPWLDSSLASGTVGPAVTLPVHMLGEHLAAIEHALDKEKLVARLLKGDRAAFSELHAIALCVPNDRVEIEIEPPIIVGNGPRVPDFRVRMHGEPWVHVEVTAPTASETALAAQGAASELVRIATLRDGMTIQVRFRREPLESDQQAAAEDLDAIQLGAVIDRAMFVMHASPATHEVAPIGGDESGRPIYGCMTGLVDGDRRSAIVVRVPYTDERAQQVLDAEAKQLPKEGPGLVCVLTTYGAYWSDLIERSYSPKIRRRISGALLFQSGIRGSESGYRLPTTGRLVANRHARTPLPDWLLTHLETLPSGY